MMLEIRDVKKSFGGQTVLDGISLDVVSLHWFREVTSKYYWLSGLVVSRETIFSKLDAESKLFKVRIFGKTLIFLFPKLR